MCKGFPELSWTVGLLYRTADHFACGISLGGEKTDRHYALRDLDAVRVLAATSLHLQSSLSLYEATK